MTKLTDLQIDIDVSHHEDIAALKLALDDQGYTATDEAVFIAWTLYSQDYYACEWYSVPWIGAKELTARLMNYMKPADPQQRATGENDL